MHELWCYDTETLSALCSSLSKVNILVKWKGRPMVYIQTVLIFALLNICMETLPYRVVCELLLIVIPSVYLHIKAWAWCLTFWVFKTKNWITLFPANSAASVCKFNHHDDMHKIFPFLPVFQKRTIFPAELFTVLMKMNIRIIFPFK